MSRTCLHAIHSRALLTAARATSSRRRSHHLRNLRNLRIDDSA